MDELGGVVVLGLAMTGVVTALVAALQWSQNRAEHQAPRVSAVKRTASPGQVTRAPDPHSSELHSPKLHSSDPHSPGAGFNAGAPDPVDFAGAQPVTAQRKPGPPARH